MTDLPQEMLLVWQKANRIRKEFYQEKSKAEALLSQLGVLAVQPSNPGNSQSPNVPQSSKH